MGSKDLEIKHSIEFHIIKNAEFVVLSKEGSFRHTHSAPRMSLKNIYFLKKGFLTIPLAESECA